jgi:hypothetical protein
MFLRVYLVLRIITRLTKWRSEKAEIACSIEGITADTLFAIKCLIKEHPYIILLSSFAGASVIFGFIVRIFEMPYYLDEDIPG